VGNAAAKTLSVYKSKPFACLAGGAGLTNPKWRK
jgi:hypothetical protein